MAFKRRFNRSNRHHSRRHFSRPRFRRSRKAGVYLLGTKFSMLAIAVLGLCAYMFTPLKSTIDKLIKK